jgi:hypothetical protein
VDVDPTGAHQAPIGIQFSTPGADFSAQFDDTAIVDGDICHVRLPPGAVYDRAPSNYEIVHLPPPFVPLYGTVCAIIDQE